MPAIEGIEGVVPYFEKPTAPTTELAEDTSPHDNSFSPLEVARFAVTTLMTDRLEATPYCPPSAVCEDCIAPHVQKLAESAEDEQPLQFMLLGFPCKSPNSDKVLGDSPDMAETISLNHLDVWARRIRAFYEPGAEIIIGADGRAFVDLIDVSDKTISAYIFGIREMINNLGVSVTYVGIDDLLPNLGEQEDYDAMRATLADNAESIDALRDRAKEDSHFLQQVNGIGRLLTDDLQHLYPDMSGNQVKKKARIRAYEMIRRGDVLRTMLESHFPQAARLSIHTQTDHSGKLGVRISPSNEDRLTPWHSSALRLPDGSFRLVKRRQAEEKGAQVVYTDSGQPSHLELRTNIIG